MQEDLIKLINDRLPKKLSPVIRCKSMREVRYRNKVWDVAVAKLHSSEPKSIERRLVDSMVDYCYCNSGDYRPENGIVKRSEA